MTTTEDNTPIFTELSDLDTTSNDGENESDSGEPVQVEWLATTRAKRSTAGNRMKSMLANEEPAAEDSDLELLFAEDEDDAGFSDDARDDASDVQMDSSSDEEDQEDGADDLEGEKELERQAREKRNAQRKRKAQEAIPAKFRKKVRLEQPRAAADSSSPRSSAPPPLVRPPPRPKKKSERMSWIPAAADMPTRASDRSTTRIRKQELHQKMVEDEVRRKKQMERMERNAKRLEALKKPPMTQAERLTEAALVEKRNSKSLNRWELAEKEREEERQRKIAALNSRKLDGPVVTFWSGIQALEEGQQKHVGNLVSIEEKAPRKKRQSVAAALAAKEQESAKSPNTPNPASPIEPLKANPVPQPLVSNPNLEAASSADGPVKQVSAEPPASPSRVPTPNTLTQTPTPPTPAPTPPTPAPEATAQAPMAPNFDENAIKDRQVQAQILFGRKMNKLAKPGHAPLCVITNHPAKYRDPRTGLPFHNSAAYKEIQKAYRGDYKYSRVLEAYVGTDNAAAQGVPLRFLDPTKERLTPKTLPRPKEAPPAPNENAMGTPAQVQTQQPVQTPTEPMLVPIAHPVTEARLVPVEMVKPERDLAIPPRPPTHHTTV
ncbi:YL1 nuclear protein-domain-containing protein [Immersiella caudata]|uniref:YL1 nuclear protein-domain-containing protein n=1 Tax=Immersiella caudata TaxID=314043 RepID=A0AA39WXU3_9PEZI|nr:YL1 nuclear protein-domain-containing protein [Immersiella caudata]